MISLATLRALSPPKPPPWEGVVIHDADDVQHLKGREYVAFKSGEEIGRFMVIDSMPGPTRQSDGRWGWRSPAGRTTVVDMFRGLPPRSR